MVITMRKGMASLMKEGPFSTFSLFEEETELPSMPGGPEVTLDSITGTHHIQRNIDNVWTTMEQKAPNLLLFLSQLLQNQRRSRQEILLNLPADKAKETPIYFIVSCLMRGYAQKQTSFLRKLLGLYLLSNGTHIRVINTLAGESMCGVYNTQSCS